MRFINVLLTYLLLTYRRCGLMSMAETCKRISVVCCERENMFTLLSSLFSFDGNDSRYYYSASVWQQSNVMIVSMCLSCPHDTWPTFTKFLCMLPVTVARFSSDGTAIRYALPVLLTTTRYLHLPEKMPSQLLSNIAPFSHNGPCNAFLRDSSQAQCLVVVFCIFVSFLV